MNKLISCLLICFATIGSAEASLNEQDEPQYPVRTRHVNPIQPPTETERAVMRSLITHFKIDYLRTFAIRPDDRLASESRNHLVLTFLLRSLACPNRSLRGQAYLALSEVVHELSVFRLAYSYALDLPDETAVGVYERHRNAILQHRPENARNMGIALDAVVWFEFNRKADMPHEDRHPLEVELIKRNASSFTLANVTMVARRGITACRTAFKPVIAILAVYVTYDLIRRLVMG